VGCVAIITRYVCRFGSTLVSKSRSNTRRDLLLIRQISAPPNMQQLSDPAELVLNEEQLQFLQFLQHRKQQVMSSSVLTHPPPPPIPTHTGPLSTAPELQFENSKS